MKTRFSFRFKVKGFNFFFSCAKVQTLKGVTSTVKKDRENYMNSTHHIFWDLEKCNIEQAIKDLRYLKHNYGLGRIFVLGDAKDSFRALCFDVVDFKYYLEILLDSKYLDSLFFYYTVKRREATIRTCRKQGRGKQAILHILEDAYDKTTVKQDWVRLKKLKRIIYDTGLVKKGISLEVVRDG